MAVLLLDVANNSFGYAAFTYKVNPTTLTSDGSLLEAADREALISILEDSLRPNRLKTLESEKPLSKRSQDELYESGGRRGCAAQGGERVGACGFALSAGADPGEATQIAIQKKIDPNTISIVFMNWLDPGFIVTPQSSNPLQAGVSTAILGSLYVIAITMLFAFPVGVGASIYLQEYAHDSTVNRLIQTNINNLAGVPSIIYGMLGLTIFVRALSLFTSGVLVGYPNADPNNGRTILSAGLTMGLLILPVIIINGQEAIKAVPSSLREASLALGATKWQTVWNHVLPNALPGILTGTILAMSRAIGETAPLVIVGASTYITFNPDGVFSKFTTLPIQIYQWTSRPQDEWRSLAAAAILVLLVLLLSMNALAIYLRNRTSRRLS